jgi:YD repeat-containing protein
MAVKAYSSDLRTWILKDYDGGMTTRLVALKYDVSESWVRRLKQRRRETGEVEPRPTDAPTIPITIYRQDRAGGYSETIVPSTSVAPTLDVNDEPTGAETFTASDIVSLSRSYSNAAEQVTHVDNYFSVAGLTYTSGTTLGVEGTDFLRTRYKYDQRGRVDRVEDSTGSIQRTVYDGLGRVTSTWIGTNDTPSAGSWPPTNNDGTSNMVQTVAYEYGEGSVGDGNLTLGRVFADDMTFYDTVYQYDFRIRVTDTRGPDNVASELTHNNVDQVTRSDVYADWDEDFVIDSNAVVPVVSRIGEQPLRFQDRRNPFAVEAERRGDGENEGFLVVASASGAGDVVSAVLDGDSPMASIRPAGVAKSRPSLGLKGGDDAALLLVE